jgi:hypothetical protein
MATLRPIQHRTLTEQAAYYRLCRLLAKHVRIGEFHGRELYEAMQRPAVKMFAELAVKKYFNRGEDTMKVKRDMVVMYQAFLVMAPILQRIPRSLHIDQHRGHVLTWLRVYAGGNARRRFVSVKEIEREHNPAILTKRLEQFGIHDRTFTKILVALFRSYYWRDTIAGNLARLLFDPIMIDVPRDRHVLRIGNRIFTLHKQAVRKSVNLNRSPLTLFDYVIKYDTSVFQNKLTITLSPAVIASFKAKIRGIMARKADPKFKIEEIEAAIEKFTERFKWAKDDREGVNELRGWLWRTMQPLTEKKPDKGAKPLDVKHIPNVLVNKWFQKRAGTVGRFIAKSNIFYTLDDIEPDTFLNFLSPYREV